MILSRQVIRQDLLFCLRAELVKPKILEAARQISHGLKRVASTIASH